LFFGLTVLFPNIRVGDVVPVLFSFTFGLFVVEAHAVIIVGPGLLTIVGVVIIADTEAVDFVSVFFEVNLLVFVEETLEFFFSWRSFFTSFFSLSVSLEYSLCV
jgi:hypothetical protein